jgi:c-di-GMP-binding flagellar brake protein YcgR
MIELAGSPIHPMINQRQFARINLRLQAQISFSSWSNFKTFYTLNISKGGMLLEFQTPLEFGATINLKLAVPGREPIDIEAEVRHCGATADGGYLVGVQFTKMDDFARMALETLIDENLPAGE